MFHSKGMVYTFQTLRACNHFGCLCLPTTPVIQEGHHILNLFAGMHVCAVLELKTVAW